MYSLKREADSEGDSGPMSMAVWMEGDQIKWEHDSRPRVGVAMRVGGLSARTYSYQDWWQTTLITEILEESENYVRFRTGNSIYEWSTTE